MKKILVVAVFLFAVVVTDTFAQTQQQAYSEIPLDAYNIGDQDMLPQVGRCFQIMNLEKEEITIVFLKKGANEITRENILTKYVLRNFMEVNGRSYFRQININDRVSNEYEYSRMTVFPDESILFTIRHKQSEPRRDIYILFKGNAEE